MGLGRAIFAGDIGNWLDTSDNKKRMDDLRRHLRRKSRVDQAQDERIAALEAENERLQVSLSYVVRLLVGKGLLSEADVLPLADAIHNEETDSV